MFTNNIIHIYAAFNIVCLGYSNSSPLNIGSEKVFIRHDRDINSDKNKTSNDIATHSDKNITINNLGTFRHKNETEGEDTLVVNNETSNDQQIPFGNDEPSDNQEKSIENNKTVDRCVLSEKIPDPKCCGVQIQLKHKRSIGGEAILLTEYPWLVRLEYPKVKSNLKTLCAGFLVTGKHVLTSAHCIFKQPIRVILGDHDNVNDGPDCQTLLGVTKCNDGAIKIDINNITVHPNYNESNSWINDIAVISLKDTAPYTDFIRPICLPTSDITKNGNTDLSFHFAGWGSLAQIFIPVSRMYQNVLVSERLKVVLPYMSNEECQKSYSKTIITKVTIWNTTICAGGVPFKNACVGDSGGPLMYDNKGVFEATGILSYTSAGPCGMKDVPSGFVNVYAYDKWIREQILNENNSLDGKTEGNDMENKDY